MTIEILDCSQRAHLPLCVALMQFFRLVIWRQKVSHLTVERFYVYHTRVSSH